MPGQAIIELVTLLGLVLEDRDAAASWIYDGKSIALWYTSNLWDEDEPKEKKWFTDHDLLHEIAHWIIASPIQREFPEYGLCPAPTDVNALGEFRKENGDIDFDNPYDGLIPMDIQIEQETRAQALCIGLGLLFNISCKLGEDAQGIDNNWRSYYRYKILEE